MTAMMRLFALLLAALAAWGTGRADGLYTNLADEKSIAEAVALMNGTGIGAERAEAFARSARQAAEAFEGQSLAGAVWRPLSQAAYDAFALQEAWDKRQPDFMGYNCRLTAYALMQDRIVIDSELNEAPSLLSLDLAAYKEAPLAPFDADRLPYFQALFNEISASQAADSAVHVAEIQAYYQARGIRFLDGPSLITVYVHDASLDNPGQYCVFPGHVGVLIEREQGIYFIEKLAFQMPYQVTCFPDRKALARYLEQAYASFQTEGLSKVILMENNGPLT